MSKFLEMLPVATFFLLYKFFNIFIATIGLIITTVGLTILEYVKTRRISKFNLINLGVLLTMSSITLISEDTTFIKMKPAILYICLAIFLLFDYNNLFVRKVYQKIFHEKGILLNEKMLRKITTHWIILLLVVAFTNEIIWRVCGEDMWVNFKVFFVPIILVLMMLFHVVSINKNQESL